MFVPYNILIEKKDYRVLVPISWEAPIFNRVISFVFKGETSNSNTLMYVLGGFEEAGMSLNEFNAIKLNSTLYLSIYSHLSFAFNNPKIATINVRQTEYGWWCRYLNSLIQDGSANNKLLSAANCYIKPITNKELTGVDAFTAFDIVNQCDELYTQHEVLYNSSAKSPKEYRELNKFGSLNEVIYLANGDITKADIITNMPTEFVLQWQAAQVIKNQIDYNLSQKQRL